MALSFKHVLFKFKDLVCVDRTNLRLKKIEKCKKHTFPKWQCCLSSKNGYFLVQCIECLALGNEILCNPLIVELQTSWRPEKWRLYSILEDLNFCSSWNGLKSKWEIANFISSILPTQEWSQGVLRHFGNLEMWSITHLWKAFKDSSWN